MTQDIRKRIEQIRRGEVPEGYKKTKVGIVPVGWKIVTMGDIYIERKEKGDPSLPVLTVSIHSGVSNGELDEEELGKRVKRIEDKTQYLTVRKDDLVFNMMRAWQGAIGVAQTDGLVSPAYIVAKPIIKLCPAFMNKHIKLPESINSLHKKSYGVTDFRLRLYWDSFVKVDCCLPPLPEQETIAEILTTQDRLIALCERKIEELKKLKKAFLQKMFPKLGASVPEWRFPQFTAPWEQRKVGTFASVFSASRVHKDEWRTEGVPFYRSSDVVSAFKGNDNERAFISTELYEELIKSSGRLEKGDILITGGGSIGIPYIVPNNEPLYSKDADLIWIKKSTEHDSQYLYVFLVK